MLWLLALLLILFFVNYRSDIAELRAQLAHLQRQMNKLQGTPAAPAEATPPQQTPVAPPAPPLHPQPPETSFAKPRVHAVAPPPPSFEQRFGGNLFVWLGGIALALAGIFLVKYSIESGLLTPQARVILGGLFGLALLQGARIVRAHPRWADNVRISQALAGAGLADLYGVLFAATSVYHLLPDALGFLGMAGVTAAALVLSLRHGPPIALLGLVGGFATPLLFQGDANAPLLFGYLYLVFGGFSFVARRQNRAALTIPAVLFSFLWVGFWLASGSSSDAIWLLLFLLGVGAAIAALTRPVLAAAPHADLVHEDNNLTPMLRSMTLGGAILLAGLTTATAHFGLLEWGLFGLFAAGSLVLAWLDDESYSFAPWPALVTSALMLLLWETPNLALRLGIALGFGLLFSLGGYLLLPRARRPLLWASLSVSSALAYFLLSRFIALHNIPGDLAATALTQTVASDNFWGLTALALGLIATFALPRTRQLAPDNAVPGIFAAATTAFVALGFAILLRQDALIFALAGEALALSWINTRVGIPALRPLVGLLTGLFAVLNFPSLEALLPGGTPLAPLTLMFQFALPALMLAGASWLLRSTRDDKLVAVVENLALALLALTLDLGVWLIADTGLHLPDASSGAWPRGVVTALFWLLGLGAVRASGPLQRRSLLHGGLILLGLGFARTVAYDLIGDNPLWSHAGVGTLPLLNGLLLSYALPTGLLLVVRAQLTRLAAPTGAFLAGLAALLLMFVYVSLNVRQFYHGAYLASGPTGNAEIYSYSLAWLLLGIGLLVAGTARRNDMLRKASMGFLILAVGKVFLYDVAELAGLWRVISFLGLGLSLLGLSWFYTRYVFRRDAPRD